MSNTAISFVMPIKNAAPFVGDALSWLSQSEIIKLDKSIEVILVDDSSSDDLTSALGKIDDPVGIIRYVKSPRPEKYRL